MIQVDANHVGVMYMKETVQCVISTKEFTNKLSRLSKCSVDALRRNCVTPTTRQVFGTDYRRKEMAYYIPLGGIGVVRYNHGAGIELTVRCIWMK